MGAHHAATATRCQLGRSAIPAIMSTPMSASPIDVQELDKAGLAALQAGDAAAARRHFEQITAAGKANASIWGALAIACRAWATCRPCGGRWTGRSSWTRGTCRP